MGLHLIIILCSLVLLKDLFSDRYYVSRPVIKSRLVNRSHDLNFHLYIDDMQHYISLKSSSPFDSDSSISR